MRILHSFRLGLAVAAFAAITGITFEATAQQPAFPGAEGAGALVTGGRGTTAVPTTVFEVTNLNDDNNPGSFRYAVTQTSATYRTVVFRISGTIHLTSALKFSKANTTIAGQTAPGDGICLADYPVTVSADNIIVRFIRFRMGDKNQNKGKINGSGDDDSFDGTNRSNIIVDHCTMSWSDDEACTFYGGDNITLQWNIISEPLNYSYHFETGDADFEHHGYGGIWGGRHASFHHNLLAHCQGRVPRFDGSRNLSPNTAGQENADFRNNVLYNWGSYNTNGGEGGNYNIVNNYYKYGPSTSTGSSKGVTIRYEIINPYLQTSSPVLPYGKYYMDGNYVFGSTVNTSDNWRGAAMNSGSLADTNQSKVTTPFSLPAVTTQTATDAYELVLQNAGVVYPNRDTLDQRIVNDVRNGTGSIIDVQGGYPHGTAYEQTVNAWPALNSATPPADSDHDGMPDNWETVNGSNPNDPADRNIVDTNGYTKLENYLNSLTTGNTLPLKLLSFTGYKIDQVAKLSWNVANETGVRNYTVERSYDGLSFAACETIKALNLQDNHQYQYADLQAGSGELYYRLKMEDVDGKTTYSSVVKLSATVNKAVAINPNPVVNTMVVSHTKASVGAKIQVLTLDGKLKFEQLVNTGSFKTTIGSARLTTGVYLLVFINGNIRTTCEFLKK